MEQVKLGRLGKSYTTKEIKIPAHEEDVQLEQKRRRARSRKIIKTFKKNRESQESNCKIVQIVAKKEFAKNELHAIFNGDTVTKNIKTRRKELKVNDTIVAIISFCLVLLTFYQVMNIKIAIRTN
jgi:hypothetical protein